MLYFIRSIISSMEQFNIPSTVFSLLYSFVSLDSQWHNNKVLPPQPAGAHPKVFHDTERVVSIIHQDQAGLPTVTNHTLDDNARQLQTLPAATGYHFLASLSSLGADDKQLGKPLRKSVASLEKLHLLLRGHARNAALQRTLNCPHDFPQEPPVVAIGESAFISRPPSPEGSDMTEVYTEIQFRYSNGATTTQYFSPQCSSIKPALLKESLTANFKHVDINTGICLFSKSVLSTSPGHGSFGVDDEVPVIPTLPRKVGLTLYELEIITRLSSAIADNVGLVENMHAGCDAPINLNIDIPDFQYYWTACELLQRGLVTVSYAQSWIAAIDERRNQLQIVMTSLIRMMLRDRLLCRVKINITSGTEPASFLVKERIAVGNVPSLDQIITALTSQGEDAGKWREFLNHLDSRYQPFSVGDLSRLIYVFKAVKPALVIPPLETNNPTHESIQATPGRKLIIQVDDVNEWKILDRGKALLKTYLKKRYDSAEQPILVGLFAMQRIFAAGSGRSDLYLRDPGCCLRLDPEETIVSPLDIIGGAYGLHIKEQLRLSCLRAGFK